MRTQIFVKALLLFGAAVFCFSMQASAQKFKKKKPETLYARNKHKHVSPVYVGIGTQTPSAQLHTVGTVRFEGIANNNTLNSLLAIDASGNLYWRDISNTITNAWFLNGNTVTPSTFFGTTNNDDIRIRTNNVQKAVITSGGFVGIGVNTPTAQLHTNGTVRFEGLPINIAATRIITVDNTGNLSWQDISSLAGTGWLLSGNTTIAGNFFGTVNADDIRFRTNNTQKAVLTSGGSLGIGINNPTAQLHTNGSVRFEGITNNNSFPRLAVFNNGGNHF